MADQPAERMIPILPCRSIDDQLPSTNHSAFHVVRETLDVDDRAALADELARAGDLRRTLT